MQRYSILLTPDLEDGGYVVTVPALEGGVTDGDTLRAAIENAREAAEGYIESMTAHDRRAPTETVLPRLVTIEVHAPAGVAG